MGRKPQRDIERIIEKYIKFLKKLKRDTPAYIFRADTEEDRREIRAERE